MEMNFEVDCMEGLMIELKEDMNFDKKIRRRREIERWMERIEDKIGVNRMEKWLVIWSRWVGHIHIQII